MKFLFVVQGEGRGHFTQALTMEQMLRRNGHVVTEVLVGKSRNRALPAFFTRNMMVPIRVFASPNFLPTAKEQRPNLGRSVIYNVLKTPEFLRSMAFIRNRIRASEADVVVNFYELLTGLTYGLFRPEAPCLCIGHQYLFLHPQFEFPEGHRVQQGLLRFFTRLTSWGCQARLALSFRRMEDCPGKHLYVIPPLLRREVTGMEHTAFKGKHILGYVVNAGFADGVREYHRMHPDQPLHFFWDREDERVDDTLSFHHISDVKFLEYMRTCKAYATTAGFESVCEAMYLGKPVQMIPVHVEQECNAHDAERAGAGWEVENFSLDTLAERASSFTANNRFPYWVRGCEARLIGLLEDLQLRPLFRPHFSPVWR